MKIAETGLDIIFNARLDENQLSYEVTIQTVVFVYGCVKWPVYVLVNCEVATTIAVLINAFNEHFQRFMRIAKVIDL